MRESLFLEERIQELWQNEMALRIYRVFQQLVVYFLLYFNIFSQMVSDRLFRWFINFGLKINWQVITEVKSIVDLFAVLAKNLTDQIEPEEPLDRRYLLSANQSLYLLVSVHVISHSSKLSLN